MTVYVIDGFETVKIHDHHGAVSTVAYAAGENFLKVLIDQAPVGQLGKGVETGQVFDLINGVVVGSDKRANPPEIDDRGGQQNQGKGVQGRFKGVSDSARWLRAAMTINSAPRATPTIRTVTWRVFGRLNLCWGTGNSIESVSQRLAVYKRIVLTQFL